MSEPSLPRRKRLRLPGFDYSSPHAYFVTVCTHDRRSLFGEYPIGAEMLQCILDGAQDTAFTVMAVCVMPDHWHALVVPHAKTNELGHMVRAAKGKATVRLRALGITGRIWQARFYDHVIRAEEDLRQVAEYIVNNPVRKGLATRLEDYPFAKIFPEAFPM